MHILLMNICLIFFLYVPERDVSEQEAAKASILVSSGEVHVIDTEAKPYK